MLVISLVASVALIADLPCPQTYRDAVDGARAALRAARSAGHRRLLVTLPVLAPGVSLDDDLRPDGSSLYPGGGAESHRKGLQPLARELFAGYEPTFHGKIDVGMGVWSLAGGDVTAVSSVADTTFETFSRLCDGDFGAAPTRAGHTLLLLNPRFTTAANIGQPWQLGLRQRAAELLDESDWLWIYRCRPLVAPDGTTSIGVALSSELTADGERCSHRSVLYVRGERLIERDGTECEPFTSARGLADARSLARASTPRMRRVPPPRMLASDGRTGGCKYGTREYWDGMYRGDGQAAADGLPAEAYSWYCGWTELEPFWRELVPDERASVLLPGVGNDRTVVDMYESGYAALTAFDYSPDAVERAAALFAPRPIKLLCADATALPFCGEGLFDAVLDKGALDAIGIYSEASLHLAASELARVLKPGGIVLSVSRALDEEAMLGAFDDTERWKVLRDGGLHLAESGEASTDLAASLYAWRRQ